MVNVILLQFQESVPSTKLQVPSQGGYIKYVGVGEQRVLQIFQKIFRIPGDHGAKYFMTQ